MQRLIVNMLFGSHLYGLNTPDSDKDFKGVFMPAIEDVLLQRVSKSINTSTGNKHSKNTKDDVDTEFFSLQYFIELACQGQTVAIDMLHAPDHVILQRSPLWDDIVANRERLYSKNLTAFVGYCRRQANKYGIRGSRLAAARSVVEFLQGCGERIQLRDLWHALPTGEHIHFLDPNPRDTSGLRLYQVVGKRFIENARVGEVIVSLNKFLEDAGDRARLAEANQGIDWKALSHALRAATQIEDLLSNGTIRFPLDNTDFLLKVKRGELDYLTEVAPALEEKMAGVEELTASSTLPEKVDRKWWNDFLLNALREEYDLA